MTLNVLHFFPDVESLPAPLKKAKEEVEKDPSFLWLTPSAQVERIETAERRWVYWFNETGSI